MYYRIRICTWYCHDNRITANAYHYFFIHLEITNNADVDSLKLVSKTSSSFNIHNENPPFIPSSIPVGVNGWWDISAQQETQYSGRHGRAHDQEI